MRYISLFAGIGGFDLALSRAGHVGVYANEWDKYASSIFKRHFGSCDSSDIRHVRAYDIPDHDLLVGGFPCQAFSLAGKRAGFMDTRGTLFFEIARILEKKRPRYVLLENVKGLLSHDRGRTFGVILQALDELGYDLQWQIINSKYFVPQNRERIFIVGHLRGSSRPEVFPLRGDDAEDTRKIGEEVSFALDASYYKGINTGSQGGRSSFDKMKRQMIEVTKNVSDAQRIYNSKGIAKTLKGEGGGLGAKTGLYMVGSARGKNEGYVGDIAPTLTSNKYEHNNHVVIPVLTPDRVNKRQNGRRFKEDGDPAFTLTAQDKHGVFDGYSIRRLTPVECERLQGFPDGWTEFGFQGERISDTQRYKCLGNAVTVDVISAIVQYLPYE